MNPSFSLQSPPISTLSLLLFIDGATGVDSI
jgi:hypothetical protein